MVSKQLPFLDEDRSSQTHNCPAAFFSAFDIGIMQPPAEWVSLSPSPFSLFFFSHSRDTKEVQLNEEGKSYEREPSIFIVTPPKGKEILQ